MKIGTIPVIAFLEDLCSPPWTLVAWRGDRWRETKECRTKQDAAGFINKHRGCMLRVLLGRTVFPLEKEPGAGDLFALTGAAVAIPWKKIDRLPLMPPVLIEGPDHAVAAWRLLVPMHAGSARASIACFADRFSAVEECRCDPLSLMIPVPGVGSGFELVWQRKTAGINLMHLDMAGRPTPVRSTKQEDEDESFVRGDQAVTGGRGLPMIKKGWIPGEVITIFIGPPKQGKSLGIAKLVSYIVSGGSYEPGGWRAGWWDGSPVLPEARGSVIVCEEEDPRLETLARIKAAIGLPEPRLSQAMAKVHVRMLVPDISAPKQLKQITSLAEQQGDNRLITFSPFSSALQLTNYTEDAVRKKIKPIQAWIRGKGSAIVAIVHIDSTGRTSGSAVIPRVCRSGIKFEDGVMTVALANSAKMGVKMPFKVKETTVMIDGTPIDTARILFT